MLQSLGYTDLFVVAHCHQTTYFYNREHRVRKICSEEVDSRSLRPILPAGPKSLRFLPPMSLLHTTRSKQDNTNPGICSTVVPFTCFYQINSIERHRHHTPATHDGKEDAEMTPALPASLVKPYVDPVGEFLPVPPESLPLGCALGPFKHGTKVLTVR